MKLTAQDEFGLRCLIHVARAGGDRWVTIGEIAEEERLSPAHVAKLMRILRLAGLVVSERGASGGYRLARPAERIRLSEALSALSEPLLGPCHCDRFSGQADRCAHLEDCSMRPLWAGIDKLVRAFLSCYTLADVARSERFVARKVKKNMLELFSDL